MKWNLIEFSNENSKKFFYRNFISFLRRHRSATRAELENFHLSNSVERSIIEENISAERVYEIIQKCSLQSIEDYLGAEHSNFLIVPSIIAETKNAKTLMTNHFFEATIVDDGNLFMCNGLQSKIYSFKKNILCM